jgi:hypothetical protein
MNDKPFTRKLSNSQVNEITARFEAGEDREDLAAEFGISPVYVGQLGRTRRVTESSAVPVLEGLHVTRLANPPEWLMAQPVGA